MSIECGECERDLRGGHADDCSRHPVNKAGKARVDAAMTVLHETLAEDDPPPLQVRVALALLAADKVKPVEISEDLRKESSVEWQNRKLSPLEEANRATQQAMQERMEMAYKVAHREQMRDEMAMAALQGIGTWMPIPMEDSHLVDLKSSYALKARAEWAYCQADAMFEARAK